MNDINIESNLLYLRNELTDEIFSCINDRLSMELDTESIDEHLDALIEMNESFRLVLEDKL